MPAGDLAKRVAVAAVGIPAAVALVYAGGWVLGVVLASVIEFSFRQALAMSNGSYLIFVARPIAAVFLAIALIMILLALKPLFAKKKEDWRERLTEAEKGS